MKILALEPYYGGSHRAFLDGWRRHSRHDWTLLTLPPSKWKWRMRHAALTFADQLGADTSRYDLLVCSDMLNLAEFAGLCPPPIGRLPRLVYFHENQLTYPVRVESERDYQYVLTNLTTALAADAVWFNSAFHRDQFLTAARAFLKRMPDFQPLAALDRIAAKAAVRAPGIDPIFPDRTAHPGKSTRLPTLLWAARWEHDKNPDDFFAAAECLAARGLDFQLNVIGEQFRDRPESFDRAQITLASRIRRWGHQPGRRDYLAALCESDIIVSTASHEFFGISVLEAIAAGCRPLLPNRLAYPQLLAAAGCVPAEDFLYDGTLTDLIEKLENQITRYARAGQTNTPFFVPNRQIETLFWPNHAPALDSELEKISSPA